MSKTVFSRITTWAIRILCCIVVIIGICLVMLSTLGGTSEHHRVGLEQAFSESLKANVKIGTLEQFNILPQLSLQVKDVRGIFKDSKDEFMADKIRLAFGFSDIAFGRRRIEDFQIENLRMSSESRYNLRVEQAGIVKKGDAAFIAKGQFSQRPFDFKLPLAHESGSRSVYHFTNDNHFSGHYGGLEFKGNLVPAAVRQAKIIDNLEIFSLSKKIATGEAVRGEKIIVNLKCTEKLSVEAKHDFANLKQLPFINLDKTCQ